MATAAAAANIISPLKQQFTTLYAAVHLHGQRFLVTHGDKIMLPFKLKDTKIGDTLRLTTTSLIGSRNYTLTGNPFLSNNQVCIRARVIEHTKEKMQIFEKTKKRNRKVRTMKHKNPHTVLRISEISVL